jgi:redox-sensitive bicupin YhaK (pirin superfamily)
MVEPHFKMLWKEIMPIYSETSNEGKTTKVEVIAGDLYNISPITPPPNSWAADNNNEVAVWNITMEAGASFTLPNASEGINRTLYYYEGEGLTINSQTIPTYHAVEVEANHKLILVAPSSKVKILVLQGRPINEPVIQYGPFVMNSRQEILQAFVDFENGKFGFLE